jgi:hypothetical protein
MRQKNLPALIHSTSRCGSSLGERRRGRARALRKNSCRGTPTAWRGKNSEVQRASSASMIAPGERAQVRRAASSSGVGRRWAAARAESTRDRTHRALRLSTNAGCGAWFDPKRRGTIGPPEVERFAASGPQSRRSRRCRQPLGRRDVGPCRVTSRRRGMKHPPTVWRLWRTPPPIHTTLNRMSALHSVKWKEASRERATRTDVPGTATRPSLNVAIAFGY